jgi:enoyl-CoA hydratase
MTKETMVVDGPVVVERPRAGITVLRMSRPERLNAMTAELVERLHGELDAVDADPDCRVVVLTGAGRGFCAGLDLTGYGRPPDVSDDRSTPLGMHTQQHIASLVPHLRALRQPVIAAVNGPATGGGLALVLGSDIRVAAESARFAVSFVRVGLSGCDIGTSWLLPRLIGAARAQELMLTGRTFGAAEAAALGLVVDVVPDDQLLGRCYEIAGAIIENSAFGVWMTKETMWSALEIPGLQAAIDLENRTQIMTFTTGDHTTAAEKFRSRS